METGFSHKANSATGADMTPLVYNGEVIHQRDERLSLTDMWKAAGSPSGRAPGDWRALSSTVEFADHVALIVSAGKTGSDLFVTSIGGRRPGTWAHWQVGLAYAKYLSPEFHMWCNTVVRERMMGERSSAAASNHPVPASRVAADFRAYRSVAKLIGLQGNQAILAANQATAKRYGVDLLADLGQTHLVAPEQNRLLTPSDIGVELGGKSAVAINAMLSDAGFQTGRRDAKNRLTWEPTDAGRTYAVFQDTGKRQGNGTPVRQLKWTSDIIERLRAA